jgi:hypothetical protein
MQVPLGRCFVRRFLQILAIVSCGFLGAQVSHAQTCTNGNLGTNAVYNATCSGGNPGIQGSAAFIDAVGFGVLSNVCLTLKAILSSSSYPSGAVIDARGLNLNNTSMTCPSTQPSPWSGINATVPSTVLLPAGVISITGAWTLPDGTKIIGEGAGGFEGSSNPLASTTTMRGLAVRTDTRARSFPFQTAAAPSQNS